MTIPVFSNNSKTTLSAGITDSVTTIPLVDASVFNTLIQDGAGTTYGTHEMATLTDGLNVEIVKITNANTTTDELTVVREQEGTTGYAFLSGDDIECRLTADVLNAGIFSIAPITHTEKAGLLAVDLITQRANSDSYAKGDYSIAVGASAMVFAVAEDGVALGHNAKSTHLRATALGPGARAEDNYTTSVGYTARCLGVNAVAVGYGAHADAQDNVAVGANASAGAEVGNIAIGSGASIDWTFSRSLAVGYGAYIEGSYTIAIGTYCNNFVPKSHMICGPSVVCKDSGETDEVLYFSAQENVLFSQEYDFKTAAADDVITIEIPTGSTFFVTEVGIIPTNISTVTTDPTIEFGSNAVTDAILTATQTTTQTLRKREKYNENATNWVADADNVGHTTQLTVSVTIAAAATTFLGRCYFKGLLLENE